jgi:hypothetical protein
MFFTNLRKNKKEEFPNFLRKTFGPQRKKPKRARFLRVWKLEFQTQLRKVH